MKEELLTAKRILKDPNLTQMANKRFKDAVDGEDDTKFMKDGGVMTELLEQKDEELAKFEVELVQPSKEKVVPGVELELNKNVPAEARTAENQFKKVNYSQFTPNTIKIRKAAQKEQPLSDRAQATEAVTNAISERPDVMTRKELSESRENKTRKDYIKDKTDLPMLPTSIMEWFN